MADPVAEVRHPQVEDFPQANLRLVCMGSSFPIFPKTRFGGIFISQANLRLKKRWRTHTVCKMISQANLRLKWLTVSVRHLDLRQSESVICDSNGKSFYVEPGYFLFFIFRMARTSPPVGIPADPMAPTWDPTGVHRDPTGACWDPSGRHWDPKWPHLGSRGIPMDPK